MSDIVNATAGPSGDKIRSDLVVNYEITGSGISGNDLIIEISSKVDYLFANAIEASVRRVVDAFGVSSGRLVVNDFGALDWVILGRVETCLRRAGFQGPPILPEASKNMGSRQQRERPRRSRLYIPGNQPKLMVSGGLYGADGLILDLEDSVPPAEKDAARVLVRNALVALDWGDSERMVRINQGELGRKDIEAIAAYNPHTVLLPKVEYPELVKDAAKSLRRYGGGESAAFLMPILESPLGIFRAHDIATADKQIVALTLGLEDLSAELAAPRTFEGSESFLARQMTVYAARAARIAPIASVFSDINDEEGLRTYVRRERALGFDGIGCIHPRQIPIVHDEMAPSEAEINKATRIVKAARDAEARGLGAVALGSKMVDPPVVKQAYRTVELALISGGLNDAWDQDLGMDS